MSHKTKRVSLDGCVARPLPSLEMPADKNHPSVRRKDVTFTCPLQTAQQTQQPLVLCDYETITVDAPDRDYTLTINKQTPTDKLRLEIVAGYHVKHRKIIIKITGMKGPCPNHKTSVIDFTRSFVTKTDSCLEFNALSFEYDPLKKGLIPHWPGREVYKIPINTCNHKQTIEIVVYPDIAYNFSVSIAPRFKLNFSYEGRDDFAIEIKRNVKYTQDILSTESELMLEMKDPFKAFVKVSEAILAKLKFYLKKLQYLSEAEIAFCNGVLEYSNKWEELQNQAICGLGYKLDLKLSPLLKVSCKFDIAGYALAAIPGLGFTLTMLKAILETAEVGELKVNFEIAGSIDAGISALKVPSKKVEVLFCEMSSSIVIGVEGIAGLNTPKGGSYWHLSVGGGANLGGKAGFGLKCTLKKQQFTIAGIFEGLKIYGSVYVKACVGTISSVQKGSFDATILDPLSRNFANFNLLD